MLTVASPPESGDIQFNKDGTVSVGERVFENSVDFHVSDDFRHQGRRCATKEDADVMFFDPSDCSFVATSIQNDYVPNSGAVLEIPVVFHVITKEDGTGYVSLDLIHSQLEIFNEDFRALTGSLGAAGVDTRIQFVLADEDPQGNPTLGVNYHENDSWYHDPGSGLSPMKNALNWDPRRYFNVYTNDASGALGYATFPTRSAGQAEDGVVLLWTSVGRDAPQGGIYNKGRTGTHEAGHYFGLFHTFQGGCGSDSSPYATGDLLADTNAHPGPDFECTATTSSCGGGSNPIENYMNYTNDTCMTGFSLEQANRMRCSTMHYRNNLFRQVVGQNQAPVAAFEFAVDGGSVTFTDKSSDADGALKNRFWSFGDGTYSREANPQHTYGAAGSYDVMLIAQDARGATSFEKKTVEITAGGGGGGNGGGGNGGGGNGGGGVGDGATVTDLAAAKGEALHYYIDVPERADLIFQISGGSGDADIYVRRDAKPTLTEWDHRPFESGSNEDVTLAGAAPGRYYVMIHGYTAFSGVTLSVSTAPAAGGRVLGGLGELSAGAGSELRYHIDVPRGAKNLTFEIAGGSGDADLHVRLNKKPTTSAWDFRPYKNGNSEAVTVANPSPGRWHVMLRGYRSFSGVALNVSYD